MGAAAAGAMVDFAFAIDCVIAARGRIELTAVVGDREHRRVPYKTISKPQRASSR
jgi:hypothetical protein